MAPEVINRAQTERLLLYYGLWPTGKVCRAKQLRPPGSESTMWISPPGGMKSYITLIFTFFWPEGQQWEGADFSVVVK
jgi:hypothetical protein